MTVAMEVSFWRGPPERSGSPVRKKRAWGEDAPQLMQLMMNQLQRSSPEPSQLTLDLLGHADPAAAAAASPASSPQLLSPEFLHMDPADTQPLPFGWEKCLNLQTGVVYYVQRHSGVSSCMDPRKRQRPLSDLHINLNLRSSAGDMELHATRSVLQQQQQAEEGPPSQVAHEFLADKKSEIESLNNRKGVGRSAAAPTAAGGFSTSGSSGSPPLRRRNGRIRTVPSSSSRQQQQQQQQLQQQQLQNEQLQQQYHWSLQHHRLNYVATGSPSCRGAAVTAAEDSSLDLDLNLSAGGMTTRRSSSSPLTSPQAVCTVAMIQDALRRTSETMVKREVVAAVAPSVSSGWQRQLEAGQCSVSSLPISAAAATARSELRAASPASTSSSSLASSRSGAGLKSSPGLSGV